MTYNDSAHSSSFDWDDHAYFSPNEDSERDEEILEEIDFTEFIARLTNIIKNFNNGTHRRSLEFGDEGEDETLNHISANEHEEYHGSRS